MVRSDRELEWRCSEKINVRKYIVELRGVVVDS